VDLNNTVKAAVFSATAIGLGYMFLMVPNVEFISVTIFLSGLTLGIFWGALVGGSSIMVYSVLNPLGSGLAFLPLLLGQIVAMIGIGVAGATIGKLLIKLQLKLMIIFSALTGFLCTFWYDLITTVAFPISAGYDFHEIIIYSISGIIFTLMHLISNSIIFMIVIPGYKKRLPH